MQIITRIGKDKFAELALENFKNEGMDTSFVFQDESLPTSCASIVVDEKSGENQIVVYLGANLGFTSSELSKIKNQLESTDILLVQLETNIDAIEEVISIAKKNGSTIILNPAPAHSSLSKDLLSQVDIITPNETEAAALTGLKIEELDTDAGIQKAADLLLTMGPSNVIITLGKRGCYIANEQTKAFVDSVKVDAIDTTGAGDAFNGGLVCALSEGKGIEDAVKFARVVGGLSTTKIGTSPAMPYRTEIDRFIESKQTNGANR